MENTKSLAGYTVAILIFMSAMRVFLETERFGIPIMNFISFSNMAIYALDILYGSWYFIISACILIVFRTSIEQRIIFDENNKKRPVFLGWKLVVAFGVTGIVSFCVYEWIPLTYDVSIFLRIVIFVGLGLFGIWAIYCCDIRDRRFLFLTLIFSYGFLITKVVVKYESYLTDSNAPASTTIKFKENRPDFVSSPKRRFITSTMDFAFTYDSADSSYTAYPMSEVVSIHNQGNMGK
jgi:hypothetical protein